MLLSRPVPAKDCRRTPPFEAAPSIIDPTDSARIWKELGDPAASSKRLLKEREAGRSSRCIQILSILLATSFAIPAIAAPQSRGRAPKRAEPAPPPAESGAAGFIALPLKRSRQNHLLVRAFINGKPALLGVDTGAPVSAIAQSRRAYFGLSPIGATAGIPSRVQINGGFANVVVAKQLRLGGLTLIDEPLVAIDLSSSSRAAKLLNEPAIDGILGVDVLFATRALVDCSAPMLVLNTDPKSQKNAPGFRKAGSQRIPFYVSEGYNLYVNSTINGRASKMMVDTGAFTTLLHQRFVRQMKVPTRSTPYTSAAINLKQRGVHVAHIKKLSIGAINLTGKDVGVIDLEGLVQNGLLDGTPPVAGLLGAEILRSHSGVIDFGSRSLYLNH